MKKVAVVLALALAASGCLVPADDTGEAPAEPEHVAEASAALAINKPALDPEAAQWIDENIPKWSVYIGGKGRDLHPGKDPWNKFTNVYYDDPRDSDVFAPVILHKLWNDGKNPECSDNCDSIADAACGGIATALLVVCYGITEGACGAGVAAIEAGFAAGGAASQCIKRVKKRQQDLRALGNNGQEQSPPHDRQPRGHRRCCVARVASRSPLELVQCSMVLRRFCRRARCAARPRVAGGHA